MQVGISPKGGGSLNIKMVGVPVGNFHGKPQKILINFSSDPSEDTKI